MSPRIETLRDALQVINEARRHRPAGAARFRVGLVTGFTPLHLGTLLQANVQERRAGLDVDIVTGLYGSTTESVTMLASEQLDAAAVVLEWPDLDPRLGMRESVRAPRATHDDILTTVSGRLDRLRAPLEALAASCPVALVMPTLGLPPSWASRPALQGRLETQLELLIATFTAALVDHDGLQTVRPPIVDGPLRDLKSDVRSGFPYALPHAAAVAWAVTEVLLPRPAKKGLITDLDDTLWRGLVGEVGPDSVSWDLDSGSHVHALYQQQLAEFARRGVLLAVASKNEPAVVSKALERPDLLVGTDQFFPIEASWGSKSAAVSHILKVWNIGADDVIFVDDNPLELAEVEAAHPGITALQFRPNDPTAVDGLLENLNGQFWRDKLSDEDAVRLASIRNAAVVDAERADASDPLTFLRDLGATITIDSAGWPLPRAIELVNKTNQFNLNGRRYDEVSWRKLCTRDGAVACTISYSDRFGVLGVIGVIAGVMEGASLNVDVWVLSCRAFSRAIEQHVLAGLADRYGLTEFGFDFVKTEKNAVTARILGDLGCAVGGDQRLQTATLLLTESIGIHPTHFTHDRGE